MDNPEIFRGILQRIEEEYSQREAFFNEVQNDQEDEEKEISKVNFFIIEYGSNSIKILTRFDVEEFNNLFVFCNSSIDYTSRGRNYSISPIDMLLITLTYLSSGMTYDRLAITFKISRSQAVRVVKFILKSIREPLINRFLGHPVQLREDELHFRNYANAVGAIDTTVIPILKPMDKEIQKKYYSQKHNGCGIKIQALVRPNGLCTAFSAGYRGAVHDIKVFRKSGWLERLLTIRTSLPNGAIVTSHLPALFDRGYTGLNHQGYPEAIITVRKPRNQELTREQIEVNNRIESDRVIVENYFSRLKLNFGILSKFRNDRDKYFEIVVPVCIALTNYYNTLHPMRRNNEDEPQ